MHPPPCSSADPVSRPDPETGVTEMSSLGWSNSALVLERKIRETETECGRGAGSHWLCTRWRRCMYCTAVRMEPN